MGKGYPIIVAHRGLHGKLPENSAAAMRAAWNAGIVWCECDVQLSADGVAVVIHDETLERTTSGKGRVSDFSAQQLAELRLRDGRGNVTDHRIPRLDELLELSGPDRRLLVETKPIMGKRICDIAREIQRKNGMLHSFHAEDLRMAAHFTEGGCPLALLVHDFHEIPDDFSSPVHINYESFRAQDVHKKIGVWTVNDLGHLERILGTDITMLITDYPLEAMRLLKSRA